MTRPRETKSERWKRRRLRKFVLDRDGWRCTYCGCDLIPLDKGVIPWPRNSATIDHVTPVAAGGTDDPDNLVASCYGCNLAKGRKLPTEMAA